MNLITKTEAYSEPLEYVHGNKDRLHASLERGQRNESDHFVQFYESDVSLVNSVSSFIRAGIEAGERCIVVATKAHFEGLEAEWKALGLDIAAARERGHYISLDAAETLSQFMLEGQPEPGRFLESVGRVVAQAAEGGRRVRVFGEMVALLWSEGNQVAAIRLEQLWNELAKTHSFSLFCAYAMDGFGGEALAAPFADICTQHSHVIPTESYIALDSADRLREIAFLQQKAKALEAEIAHRKEQDAEIRSLNDRLRRAMTETHHRVKNNLQLMIALIESQTQSRAEMVPMTEFVRLGQNIQALRVIHDILTQEAKEGGDADFIPIKEVLEQLLPILQATSGGRRILSSLETMFLPGKQTTALALVANELVSNAIKHGKGDVELALRAEGDVATLEVCDDGPGFAAGFDPKVAAHTGLELVENIARYDLRAEVAYENRPEGGARVVLRFPIHKSSYV